MLPTEEIIFNNKKYPLKRICNEIKKLFRIEDYKKQQLPACRPLITFMSVIPTFMITSLALLILGAVFFYLSFNDQTFKIDYTDCIPLDGSRSCAQMLSDWHEQLQGRWPPPECTCWYKFELDQPILANAYVYYGLSNYYQNHLHYIRAKDFAQFQGHPSLHTDCEPFRFKTVRVYNHNRKNVTFERRGIVPCGTRANSLFNDTYTFWFVPNKNRTILKVPLSRTNIAWPVDRSIRNSIDPDVFRDFTNPPYWGNKTIWDLDPNNPENNGLQNEALIVWMRVAAFPDFRKLYARIIHKRMFSQSLPKGQYYLKIDYKYSVKEFRGRKFFLLANTNKYIGGPYLFLAIIYMVVGGLCIILSGILYAMYRKFGIKENDLIDIDERTPYVYTKEYEKRRRYLLEERTKISTAKAWIISHCKQTNSDSVQHNTAIKCTTIDGC